MTCGVYCIEHTPTGRFYVGKSVDVERRVRRHFSLRGDQSMLIATALRKHGIGEFRWTLLERCDSDAEALLREVEWIEDMGSRAPGGFNLTAGGDGMSGHTPNEETRAKMSAWQRGKAKPAHVLAALLVTHVGVARSAEVKAKISASQKGRPSNRKGIPHTDEVRARISATQSGRKKTPEALANWKAAWHRNRAAQKAAS